jgi:LmbE family N-acetylglucosaminyl deacetylase
LTGIRVLAIAAHPDDELLGCGGTLALHVKRGDIVTVAVLTQGRRGADWPTGYGPRAATIQLGIGDLRWLDFPDQAFDTIPMTTLVSAVERLVQETRPDTIYTHHGGDVNRDHQLVFQAVLVAARPTQSCVRSIYAFETASSTEWGYPRSFVPDTWVDISSTIGQKLHAVRCYESELRAYPHPRSTEALQNRARAQGNLCCLESAEVFMTVRRVIRDSETLD